MSNPLQPTRQPTRQQMDNALIAAATAYAEMENMTATEVLDAISGGNETVRNSVMLLMFAALSPDIEVRF